MSEAKPPVVDLSADPRPPQLDPRRPRFAALLSLLAPGLGHMYCAMPGPALLLGLFNQLFAPLLLAGWALTDYPVKIYAVGAPLAMVLPRLIAVPWAYFAAKGASRERTVFNQPGAYGAFLIGMILLGMVSMEAAKRRYAVQFFVPTDDAGYLAGDYALLRKHGVEPRVGKVAAYEVKSAIATDLVQTDATQMREVRLGRVSAVHGDTFEVEGADAGIERSAFLGEAGPIFQSGSPDAGRRWDRIGLKP